MKISLTSGIAGFFLWVLLAIPVKALAPGEIKISYAFRSSDTIDCQMALTQDSVAMLIIDSGAGALEPDDENDFADAERKRAFSPEERERAEMLLTLTRKWKGLKKFNCDKNEGYAFSIWTDSLSLHCKNCFSCSEGIGIQDAKILARLGKLTLWLYNLREDMP